MALTKDQEAALIAKILSDSKLSDDEIRDIFANKSQFGSSLDEIKEELEALQAAAEESPGWATLLTIAAPFLGGAALLVAAAGAAVYSATSSTYEIFIGKFAEQTIKEIESGVLRRQYFEEFIVANKQDLFIDETDVFLWTRDDNFINEIVAAIIKNPNSINDIPYLESVGKFDLEASKKLRALLDGTGLLIGQIPYVGIDDFFGQSEKANTFYELKDPRATAIDYSGNILVGVFDDIASDNTEIADLRKTQIQFNSTIGEGAQLPSTSNVRNIDEDIFVNRYGIYLLEAIQMGTNTEAGFNAHTKSAAAELGKKFGTDVETKRRIDLWDRLVAASGGGLTAEEVADAISGANAAALEGAVNSGLTGAIDDSAGLSESDIEKRQRFYQQCCLLLLMKDLKSNFTSEISDDTNSDSPQMHSPDKIYNERFYMVNDKDNTKFVNTLIAPKGEQIRDFMNITPDIQAFLVPKVRLFKVYGASDSLKQVEFHFRNNTIPDSSLNRLFNENDVILRGSGYGIKEISFSFEGASPATAKNDIKVGLKLFFQDFRDFVTPFHTTDSTGEDATVSFVELLFFDQKDASAAPAPQTRQQYNPAHYRIRADLGWHVPNSNDQQFVAACAKRGLNASNIKNAIVKMNKSFYLTMVEHDLDFAKDGTVSITGEYRAYIEASLKTTRFDALSNKEIVEQRKTREEKLIRAERNCTPGEIAALKRVYSAQEAQDVLSAQKRILSDLYGKGKIFNLHVTSDGGFRENGFFSSMPTYNGSNVGVAEPPTTDEAVAASSNTDPSPIPKTFTSDDPQNNVQFFYLGDLIYIILDSLFEQPHDPTKFILPSIDLEEYLSNAGSYNINIAQIPVSVLYFKEWFTNTIIKPGKKSYAIMYFIRDLLNNLVVDALIEVCLNRNYNKSFRFDTTTITSNGDKLSGITTLSSPIINLQDNSDIFPMTAESETGEPVSINDLVSFVVIMPTYNTITNDGTGQYDEDIDKGVYHFEIGVDRGILNDVKFSKIDMEYIREARYLQTAGVDGLMQLGAVYKATLNLFGNTLFYPGMLIYINPFGLGGNEFIPSNPFSIANKLGLGGYHLITRVNSIISNGAFKTTLEAMFVYPGDGQTRSISQGEAQTTPEETPSIDAASQSPEQQAYCDTLLTQETDYFRNVQDAIDTGGARPLEAPPLTDEPLPFVGPVVPPESIPDPESSQSAQAIRVNGEDVAYDNTNIEGNLKQYKEGDKVVAVQDVLEDGTTLFGLPRLP
jgi:hypothetical protein